MRGKIREILSTVVMIRSDTPHKAPRGWSQRRTENDISILATNVAFLLVFEASHTQNVKNKKNGDLNAGEQTNLFCLVTDLVSKPSYSKVTVEQGIKSS